MGTLNCRFYCSLQFAYIELLLGLQVMDMDMDIYIYTYMYINETRFPTHQ